MQKSRIILIIAALFLSLPTHANLYSTLGYGATNMGMGNATVAVPTDSFSMQYNLALMAFQPKSEFSFGLEGAFTQFNSISNILIDRSDIGGASNLTGDVSTKTPDIFSTTLGLHVPIGKGDRPLHLGVIFTLPVLRVMLVDTGEPYLPTYTMFNSDTQRIATTFGLARKLSDEFSVGFGANLYLVQGTNAHTRFPTPPAGNSNARIKLEVQSSLAPSVGFQYEKKLADDNLLRAGLSYQSKQDSKSKFYFLNTIVPYSPTDLIMDGYSSLYFDPDMVNLGGSFTTGRNTYALSAQWERWSDFSSSIMRLSFESFSYVQYLMPMGYHDTVSIHTGFEHKSGDSAFRVGLEYRPTPVPDANADLNLLDSDKAVASLGYGKNYSNISFLEGVKLKLDGVLQVQYLMPKTITKSGAGFIGAPGYKIGGMVYGYGVTATAEF